MSEKNYNILGIDYGEKKVGLAITSGDHTFVFGRGIITPKSVKDCIEQIREVCKREFITSVVVGLPLNKDGTHGLGAQAVEQFAAQLQEVLGMPVALEDERMSTGLARQLEKEAERQTSRDDEDAAKVILQSYVDKISHRSSKHV